jgi:CRP/FNR family transcriptional regulator, cyclic AMP receptor protein
MYDRLENDPSEVIGLLMIQSLVEQDSQRAEYLSKHGKLVAYEVGDELISFGAHTTDVYFLLTGSVRIKIGKTIIVESFEHGHHVGEIAAIHVTSRTTTVTAREQLVALQVSKEHFKQFLTEHPAASKALALDLAKRIATRNAHIGRPSPKHRIFAISSAEALQVATNGLHHFSHDKDLEYIPWTSPEVFQLSSYPLDDLEAEVNRADFAIAIAHDDDIVQSRGQEMAMPRDNVLFELGLFMGKLGRKRTLLMAPKGKEVKLPSDLSGLSIIYYPPGMTSTQEMEVWERVKKHFRKFL